MDIAHIEQLNLLLVKEVEKYPCLYKTDTVEYYRRNITDKAWKEVGRVVGWPGTKCKEKFKNIRSVVSRYKKQMNNGAQRRPYYLMEHMRYAFPYIKCFKNKSKTETQLGKNPNVMLDEILVDEEKQQGEVKVETCLTPYRSPCQQYYEEAMPAETYPESPTPSQSSSAPVTDEKLVYSKDTTQSFVFNQSERADPIDMSNDNTGLHSELHNDPKKMFLLSLLPDLYAMDDKQTRKFKRGVLQLVDDILCDGT